MLARYLGLIALCASFGAAQQAQPPVAPLSLEEALRLADQNSPRLRVAAAGVESAEAAILTARAKPNPTLTFGSMGYQRTIAPGTVGGFLHGANYTQPLELGSLRSTRIRAAEVGRESSEYGRVQAWLSVQAAVKQAFFEAIRRRGEMDLARGTLQLLEDLQRRIRVQVNVGEAARLELTRADAEVATARIQYRAAELRHTAAISALAAAMGAQLNNREPEAPLEAPPALPALETLKQEVIEAHPVVALAEAEKKRAGALLDYEKAQRTPQPSIWADWFHQPDVAQYRFGVTITLPVRNKREGPIAEAVAATHRAEAVARERRLEITAALESAYNLYQVANQQVAMFETGMLRSAEAAVEAAEAAFRFGERGIIEVLDAQRVLRSTRLDYLNAQFDRQLALIELEQLRVVKLQGGKP